MMPDLRPIFLDAIQQEQFTREGYVILRVFTPDDLAALTEEYDRCRNAWFEGGWSCTAMSNDPEYRRALSVRIRDIVQQRVEPFLDRCKAWIGNYFDKRAGADDSTIHMHRDWSWIDESRFLSATLWAPLHAAQEANGTLVVVPRSHLLPAPPRGWVRHFSYPDLEQRFIGRYSRPLAIEAGEAVLFDQRMLHWSGPNRSEVRRLAINCFVCPEEANLRFPFHDPDNPELIELFEVDDALLHSFELGVRPSSSRWLGTINVPIPPLDERMADEILG